MSNIAHPLDLTGKVMLITGGAYYRLYDFRRGGLPARKPVYGLVLVAVMALVAGFPLHWQAGRSADVAARRD